MLIYLINKKRDMGKKEVAFVLLIFLVILIGCTGQAWFKKPQFKDVITQTKPLSPPLPEPPRALPPPPKPTPVPSVAPEPVICTDYSKCPNRFIRVNSVWPIPNLPGGWPLPKILDMSWDADPKITLGDSIWVKGTERGEVKNFLSNFDFVADVDRVMGQETNDEKIAQNIANWVKNMKPYGCNLSDLEYPCYDHSPLNNVNTNLADFDYIYHYPEGVCLDAAVITVAALRVAKIPAIIHWTKLRGMFHANALAYINNEWTEIESVFCSKEQIDSKTCEDAQFIKKLAYGVNEIWMPRRYCRSDGFCTDAPDIPVSSEVLLASTSLPYSIVTYPRFRQTIVINDTPVWCASSGWTLDPIAVKMIQTGDVKQVREAYNAYMEYILYGNKSGIKNLGIGLLPNTDGDFGTSWFNDLPAAGYFRAKMPATSLFAYICNSGWDYNVYPPIPKVVAHASFIVESGKMYDVIYQNLTNTGKLSFDQFELLKVKLKESTEDLGIFPIEKAIG